MLERRTFIAAAAGLLFVAATPAFGADAPSPNDAARFLAGMPTAAESPLAALTKDVLTWPAQVVGDGEVIKEDET